MKTLVVFDSAYGNTEKIARAVASGVPGQVEVVQAGKADPGKLGGFDFIFAGSPTQGGRATPVMKSFIAGIPTSALINTPSAAFDTRISAKWVGIFGYAAGKIAGDLKARGASLAVDPEPFFVTGKEGPLKEGEAERAAAWAKAAMERVNPAGK